MVLRAVLYLCMWITSDVQAIASHLLISAQPVPWLHPPQTQGFFSFPFCRTSHGMKYPSGQFRSSVLVLSPPSSFCPLIPFTGWTVQVEKPNCLWLHTAATAQQQLETLVCRRNVKALALSVLFFS